MVRKKKFISREQRASGNISLLRLLLKLQLQKYQLTNYTILPRKSLVLRPFTLEKKTLSVYQTAKEPHWLSMYLCSTM